MKTVMKSPKTRRNGGRLPRGPKKDIKGEGSAEISRGLLAEVTKTARKRLLEHIHVLRGMSISMIQRKYALVCSSLQLNRSCECHSRKCTFYGRKSQFSSRLNGLVPEGMYPGIGSTIFLHIERIPYCMTRAPALYLNTVSVAISWDPPRILVVM